METILTENVTMITGFIYLNVGIILGFIAIDFIYSSILKIKRWIK